jgi:hypothetical protein
MEKNLRGMRYEGSFSCNPKLVSESIKEDLGSGILLRECLIDSHHNKVYLAFRKPITSPNHLSRFRLLGNFSKMKEKLSFKNMKLFKPSAEYINFDDHNSIETVHQQQSTVAKYEYCPTNIVEIVEIILQGGSLAIMLETLSSEKKKSWYKLLSMNEPVIKNVEQQLKFLRKMKHKFLESDLQIANTEESSRLKNNKRQFSESDYLNPDAEDYRCLKKIKRSDYGFRQVIKDETSKAYSHHDIGVANKMNIDRANESSQSQSQSQSQTQNPIVETIIVKIE